MSRPFPELSPEGQQLADAHEAWDEARTQAGVPPPAGNRNLIYKFMQLPLSKRRELLGEYYKLATPGASDMERWLQALTAMRAAGKVDDFLRAVAAVPDQN